MKSVNHLEDKTPELFLMKTVYCYCFFKFSSQGLADNTVVAKVNGELWDLDRPFEKDSSLQLLKFEDAEGLLIISIN